MRALVVAVTLAVLAGAGFGASAASAGHRAGYAKAVMRDGCPPRQGRQAKAKRRAPHHAAKAQARRGARKASARKAAPRTSARKDAKPAFARAAVGLPAIWPSAGAPQIAYAVQLKEGLTKEQRDAALVTLRDKYDLRVVKTTKGIDLLRVVPRTPSANAGPPRSVGEALTPEIIQNLRKEPFVDAAYVDLPLTPNPKGR